MSDPLFIGAGHGDSVGTATIATDGTFTITAHALDDGQPVMADTFTGGAGSVLRDSGIYYVLNSTADTFQLAASAGDSIITFGAIGGATVYTATPFHLAAELRRADAGLLFPGVADAFGARQGVRPGSTPVTLGGTTWTVENLIAVVYPPFSSTSGPYRVAHPSESGALNPAHESLPRIDALDLQIQDDDEDSSGFRRARVVYVPGTPAASPAAPAVTVNSLRLATVLVPAGGVPSPSLTITAPYTVASGGVLPIRTIAERPAAGLYEGMTAYRQDDGVLEVWTGSAWEALARPLASAAGWTPIASGVTSGGPFDIDVTAGGRFPVGTFSMLRLHGVYALDGTGSVRVKVNNVSGIHTYAFITRNGNGTVENNGFESAANQWLISEASTGSNNNFDCKLFETDTASLVSFRGGGMRTPGTIANAWETTSWGDVDTEQLVSVLNVRPFSNASNQFVSIRYWLEGFRA